ncbi:hypothetical protein PIB30_073671 [Stylosanthes scabra]|uniref:Putative plant transposon protein domain-containing protein n=1 Tax=Stylosanthes scabra TaxID=79078 RepID=A0ABU6ZN74_9FABA|nr:hypothetical protein [Stylosanthes scabra]
MLSRDILHEQCIDFQGQQDFMEDRLAGLGWMFMYNALEPINIILVRKFYSNFSSANQQTVFLRGKQIPITENAFNAFLGITTPPQSKEEDAYEKNLVRKNIGALDMGLVLPTIALPGMRWDSYKPKSGRVDNAILTPQARGWQKMIVCNVQPLKHHTTFSMNMALLIYTLMEGGPIHLSRIVNNSISCHNRCKRSVVTLSGPDLEDGSCKAKKKKARKGDIPQPPPAPIPPPISHPRSQPASSSAAEEPPSSSSCTNLLQKILKKLSRRKKDLRNTQYMIRTANPGVEFPDLIPVTSSDSTDDDNA